MPCRTSLFAESPASANAMPLPPPSEGFLPGRHPSVARKLEHMEEAGHADKKVSCKQVQHFTNFKQVILDWYDVWTHTSLAEHKIRRVWGTTYAAALHDYNQDTNKTGGGVDGLGSRGLLGLLLIVYLT